MTKIVFTTELLQRICLTVSLSVFIQLALIGSTSTNPHGAVSALAVTANRNELNTKLSKLHANNGSTIASGASANPNNEGNSNQSPVDASAAGESEKDVESNSHTASQSPSSRSLLFGQRIRNFPHQRSPSKNNEKRMSSARVGSTSAYLSTKPLSFTTTLSNGKNKINRKTVIRNREYPTEALFASRKGQVASSPSFSGPTYECIFSTSNNCGQDNENKSPGKSFHGTIFNKRLSTKDSSDSKEDGTDEKDDKGSTIEGFSSVPFTIAGKPLKRVSPSVAMSFEHYSTPAPAWIKLEPYDPFAVANRRASLNANLASPTIRPPSDSDVSSSQFANRIGQEELSPESFAKRYGWTNHEHLHAGGGSANKYGGARLPTWLEELNYQQGTSPILDEIREENNRRWVKLDPVSVAGVTISKWVPKGTSPSQLPSTSLWPIRGTGSSGGGSSKPVSSEWWDRVDTEPNSPPKRHQFQPRPDSFGWSAETALNSGFGIRYPQQQHQTKRRPGISDAWNDIIYPDTPQSATASWEADKNSKFPSSHSSPQSSSSAWSTHPGRRPVASWSAPGSSFSGGRVQPGDNYPHNPNRRYGTGGSDSFYRPGVGSAHAHFGRPNSYPDPASTRDDPRWVLVSSTSKIEHVDGNRKNYGVNRGPTHTNERYASGDSDFPYEFYNSGNRHSKMLLKEDLEPSESSSSYSFTPLSQDELFRRTNETLHSLVPTLKHHRSNSSPSKRKPNTANPKRQGVHVDLSDSDNLNLQPSQDIMEDVNDDDLLSTSLEFDDVGDGRGSSSSSSKGTKATANLIVLPQRPDQKDQKSKPNAGQATGAKPATAPKRGFLEGLNPIYTAVGAGMVPATLAAILPMALGRRRRKRSGPAKFPDPVLLSMNERTQFPNSLPSYLLQVQQVKSRRV